MKTYFNRKSVALVLISAVLGAFAYVLIFGIDILNPTNDSWILGRGSDITQHYLGWKAFRAYPWLFPIGCTRNLAWPLETSVIFTDSIPVLAIFFKAISRFLPQVFQYFGLYGLICFMLQGALSAVLLLRFTKKQAVVLIGALFFILSPTFIFRMHYHTALSSHYLILLAFLPLAYDGKILKGKGRIALYYGLLGVLCVGIHIYYVAICGFVLLGYMLFKLLGGMKELGTVILTILSYSAFVLVTAYVLGAFNGVFGAARGGLGKYSMNLLAMISSAGWSRLLPELKLPSQIDNSEGFCYCGIGCFFLEITAIVWVISRCSGIKKNDDADGAGKRLRWIISGIVYTLAVFLFALSPKVYFGEKLILEIQYLPYILDLWGIFRATGRFVWLIWYPMLFFSILGTAEGVSLLCRTLNIRSNYANSTPIIFLSTCLILQIFDISPGIMQKRRQISDAFQNTYQPDEAVVRSVDSIMGNPQINHIYFASPDVDIDVMFYVTNRAIESGKTVNRFYFARKLDDSGLKQRYIEAYEGYDTDVAFIYNDGVVEYND